MSIIKPDTMHTRLQVIAALLCISLLSAAGTASFAQSSGDTGGQDGEEWHSLFNGNSLEGWRAAENPATFRVDSGRIVANGPRAHLYYTGPVGGHNFRDFEFRAEVMTTEDSNSGIYFHTRYQERGWPSTGFEIQVNNSYEHDWRRTGSLYGIDDVSDPPAEDGRWFTLSIRVEGRQVTVRIDGEVITEHRVLPLSEREGDRREISSGTFALQGHDSGSKVYYRNLQVRSL